MPNMKGITVRIDAELHAEIKAYLEQHEMTMGEFIALAAQDELHPKTPEVEVKEMENMRTLAFQVPESLFQRVKEYLERNNMTQKAFVLGLIEDELDRDEELLRRQQEDAEQVKEEQDEALSEAGEAPVTDDSPEDGYGDEPGKTPAVADFEGDLEPMDEEEIEQENAPPEYREGALGAAIEIASNFDYQEDESSAFPEPEDEEEQEFGGMAM